MRSLHQRVRETKKFLSRSSSRLCLKGWGGSSMENLPVCSCADPGSSQLGTPVAKRCCRVFLEVYRVPSSAIICPCTIMWCAQRTYNNVLYTEDLYDQVTYTEDLYNHVLNTEDLYNHVLYTEELYNHMLYTEDLYNHVLYTEDLYNHMLYTEDLYNHVLYTEDLYNHVLYT